MVPQRAARLRGANASCAVSDGVGPGGCLGLGGQGDEVGGDHLGAVGAGWRLRADPARHSRTGGTLCSSPGDANDVGSVDEGEL
eukprot:755138-Hanusia_phi.AAC.9